MKKKYSIYFKDKGRIGFLEIWASCYLVAWLRVLWWRLSGDIRYEMWRHWPLIKK